MKMTIISAAIIMQVLYCGFVNGELRVIDDKLPLPDEVAEYTR